MHPQRATRWTANVRPENGRGATTDCPNRCIVQIITMLQRPEGRAMPLTPDQENRLVPSDICFLGEFLGRSAQTPLTVQVVQLRVGSCSHCVHEPIFLGWKTYFLSIARSCPSTRWTPGRIGFLTDAVTAVTLTFCLSFFVGYGVRWIGADYNAQTLTVVQRRQNP